MKIYECDLLKPPPAVCGQIAGYPTFCCPGDESCDKTKNLQVGYATGAGFKTMEAKAEKKCKGNATDYDEGPSCTVE